MSVKGDERRTALLGALEEHLRTSSLEAVTIADLSRRAGVTRSAFYFYFESKAEAVAALMEGFYDEAFAAALHLGGDGHPAARFRACIETLADAVDRHRHTYAAMLAARATHPEVRALWEADRTSFVPVVADVVTRERAAGRAPAGVDAAVLAGLLLDLNDRLLERLALQPPADERAALVDGAVACWLGAIHGRTDHLDAQENR